MDLDLVIPPQLLPSPAEGETLENLKLGSNSHVSADVVVVGQRKKRASLVAESKHGNVKINIVRYIIHHLTVKGMSCLPLE